MITKKSWLAVVLGLAVLVPASATVVLDFDNVPDVYGLTSYTQDPYTLTASHGYSLATPQTPLTSQPLPSSGYLWTFGGTGEASGFTLTREGQQPFHLFSFSFGGPYSTVIDKLEVTGQRVSGETVQMTWYKPDTSRASLYMLDQADAGWLDLVSVDFAAYAPQINRAVFDNIVLMDSPVPEPSTLLLMLLGCAGLRVASRRREARAVKPVDQARQSRD
jgi:hypothetical protein